MNRVLPSDPSGTWLRIAHGESASGCIGSSTVRPQVYSPNPEAGSSMVRELWSCCASHAEAVRQYGGISSHPGPGRRSSSQAGAATANTSSPANAISSRRRHAVDHATPAPCTNPRITVSRSIGSNLWTLRNGASGPLSRCCHWCEKGESTRVQPAGHQGLPEITYATHWLVPRRLWNSDNGPVVFWADSM